MQIIRFFRIFQVIYQFNLFELCLLMKRPPMSVRLLCKLFAREKADQVPLPVRVRLALEKLGTIFIKFGQMLSTRRDLLPSFYADELEKLQDKVPPFNGELAIHQIEHSFGCNINELYVDFDRVPVASASVAQVHHAWLKKHDGSRGEEVAVKILRPGIQIVIEQDLRLLYSFARMVQYCFQEARLLRLFEVVSEFDKILHDELDLMHEAGNASQIKRDFQHSDLIIIPKVFFDYCHRQILTMQWVQGIPISHICQLQESQINLKRLAENGVNIFFQQVFCHGFFHADMHPGNIFVDKSSGRYIAVDFGIVGTLTEYDKKYLAINFLAFFNRNYRRVASAHIECGWVPKNTDVIALESAVRTVCEPIFEKPLSQISFGIVLLRLFETCRRFNVSIQPQLVLLQKTLLNIEGLGRQLDPELDLWVTAKPFLQQWMNEQIGWKGFMKNILEEIPVWNTVLPTLPRKVDEALSSYKDSYFTDTYKNFLIWKRFQCLLHLIVIMLLLGIFLY